VINRSRCKGLKGEEGINHGTFGLRLLERHTDCKPERPASAPKVPFEVRAP